MAATTTAFHFAAPISREMPELRLGMKKSQERSRTPQTPRRALTTSWDDIVAGRKMLKASLNAEDLNLLLDSLENPGTGSTPTQSRFLFAAQRELHHDDLPAFSPTSSINNLPAPSLSCPPAQPETPMVPPFKADQMMSSLEMTPSAVSKLEQEYEVIATGLQDAPFFSPFEQSPMPSFFTESRSDLGVHAPVPMQIENLSSAGPSFTSVPELKLDFGSAARASMEMSPMLSGQTSEMGMQFSSQWNLTSKGKEYLAQKQQQQQFQHMHEPCQGNCKPKCSYCAKISGVSDALAKHVNRKHNHIKTYRCTYIECGKTFITRKEQQNHIARHSTEPKYFCEYPGCQCKYTTKSSLDLHVTRIHGDKKYKCDLCDERYSVRGDLNQHMKRKHNKTRRLM